MKKKIILGVGALALTVGAVFASDALRAQNIVYYQEGSNCRPVQVTANQFTTTGTSQAAIRTAAGSLKLLVSGQVNSSTCNSTPIYFNP